MGDGGDGRGDELGPLADQYFVSFAGTATSIIFVATKALSRQNTSFVATKVCLFCRDKHTFVATKDVFCHDKHVFVATKK